MSTEGNDPTAGEDAGQGPTPDPAPTESTAPPEPPPPAPDPTPEPEPDPAPPPPPPPCGGVRRGRASGFGACCRLRLRGRTAIGLDLCGRRADPADQRVLQLVHRHGQRLAARRQLSQQECKRERLELRRRREAGVPACSGDPGGMGGRPVRRQRQPAVPGLRWWRWCWARLALLVCVIKFFSKPGGRISRHSAARFTSPCRSPGASTSRYWRRSPSSSGPICT